MLIETEFEKIIKYQCNILKKKISFYQNVFYLNIVCKILSVTWALPLTFMKLSDHLGPKRVAFFVRYGREFVLTVIVITVNVITQIDCSQNRGYQSRE